MGWEECWDQSVLPFPPQKTTGTLKEGIKLEVTLASTWIDAADQIIEYSLAVRVTDGGQELDLHSSDRFRVLYPQEFLLLVERCGSFEFMGWWNNWDLDEPLARQPKIERPLILLRRRGS